MLKKFILLTILILSAFMTMANAELKFDGDFRVRWYSDHFYEALDNRLHENYMRYSSRFRVSVPVSEMVSFQSELLVFMGNNPLSPVRNIAGTGTMYYGISQIFADVIQPNFLFFDVARLRVGRQHFPIGKGLSLGDSYYYVDLFDGARIDLSYGQITLSSMGSILGQNLSASGLYPDPGSDQLYATRLGFPVLNSDFILYHLYQKPRGIFNDSNILGAGLNGKKFNNRMTYFAEVAHQVYNTAPGLPEKGGSGYMAGISYRRPLSVFRSVKVETRYAAYEGDDAATDKVEIFSPMYPSFFWGSRTGYVNGAIGGSNPLDERNLEGCRIWFSRIYFIPKWIPELRVQFDYVQVSEFNDNDQYNTFDDEFSVKVYYAISNTARLHFRYSENYPNEEDFDVNSSGTIAWSEDRVARRRYMLELQIKF